MKYKCLNTKYENYEKYSEYVAYGYENCGVKAHGNKVKISI